MSGTKVLVGLVLAFALILGCASHGGPDAGAYGSSRGVDGSQPAVNGHASGSTGGNSTNGSPAMNATVGETNGSDGTMEAPAMNGTTESGNGTMEGAGMNGSGETYPEGTGQGAAGGGNGSMEAPAMNGTTGPASYQMEADDSGFYMGGRPLSTLAVKKGTEVDITFTVRTSGVYHSGLDFRGCGASVPGTPPGGSASFSFTADSPCGITSYWPSTGVAKKTLSVSVG